MSTAPRNPRHYPHMKVRGSERKRQAPLRRLERTTDLFVAAMRRMSVSVVTAAAAMNKLGMAGSMDAGFRDERASVAMQDTSEQA